jgi:transforming growth factor-beta-induced protein
MKSREGQKLNLTCDANDRIRVNDVPVAESDIVALNGVIHVIEELLIPDSVKSIENILEDMSYYKFIEYAQQAGIQDVLSGDAPGNYTIFVPNDAAFKGKGCLKELIKIIKYSERMKMIGIMYG